jgi:hypothetical protein
MNTYTVTINLTFDVNVTVDDANNVLIEGVELVKSVSHKYKVLDKNGKRVTNDCVPDIDAIAGEVSSYCMTGIAAALVDSADSPVVNGAFDVDDAEDADAKRVDHVDLGISGKKVLALSMLHDDLINGRLDMDDVKEVEESLVLSWCELRNAVNFRLFELGKDVDWTEDGKSLTELEIPADRDATGHVDNVPIYDYLCQKKAEFQALVEANANNLSDIEYDSLLDL